MNRALIPLILLLITATVFTSGCETKTANQTWGEKKINLTLLTEADNTTTQHEVWDGIKYYYIDGYLVNKNPYDALDVKLKATALDAAGNVVAVNDTPYLEPKTIPSNGVSNFYFEFVDPDEKIVSYRVEVLSAQAQYGT